LEKFAELKTVLQNSSSQLSCNLRLLSGEVPPGACLSVPG
jgi:hypothetical protein